MAKVVKKTGTAVANWDEELAKRAEMQSDARSSGGGGSFIGVSASGFTYKDSDIGPEMDIVVLDFVNENQYYDKAFDRDNPTPPVCFAFSRKEADLTPHENSTDKQNETCLGCPQNAFGSAGNGRKGKACKNVMRLALITEGDLEDVEAAEVAYLKVSTTNVRKFTELLEKMKNPNYGKFKKPSYAFIVTMSVKPNKKTQIEMDFAVKEVIADGEQLKALMAKVDDMGDTIMTPYQPANEDEEPAALPAKNIKLQKRR